LVVALAIGMIASSRSPRVWLRDAFWCAAGGLLVALPVLAWFGNSVGLGRFFYEAAIHPLEMLQALPVPELTLPRRPTRAEMVWFFVTLEFRLYALLYLAYALWLARRLVRAVRERRSFEDPLLLATVIWGGTYFLRSFGRADEPHLDSAIPPVCLLLAYTVHLAHARWPRLAREPTLVIASFALWIYLLGVDTILDDSYLALKAGPELEATWSQQTRIEKIREWSLAGERILDLTASPLLHVASERLGPGYRDVVMPGTFAGEGEEARFLERLEASPPALVLWPLGIFDAMPERSLRRTAPRVVKWVLNRYQLRAFDDEIAFLLPIRPGQTPAVEDLTGRGRVLVAEPRRDPEEPARGRRSSP
jgi:hypothetical protein